MDVIKASGDKEPFNLNKLCDSIKLSGAPDNLAESVCELVAEKLPPSVSTTQIFRRALSYLVKEDIEVSARYSLRRGIAELGPDGFTFEKYFEALMQAHGYETEKNVIMQGNCVDHEIDVIVRKGTSVGLVEAKFRNDAGVKTHIDTVMYADARLIDIATYHQDKTFDQDNYHMWVVTNTKFTDKAIQYGKCRRMKLIGWSYPADNSLEKMIIDKNVYPVTVLPSVSLFERQKLLSKGIILVQDLLTYTDQDLVKEFDFPPEIASKIMDEVQGLVQKFN